MQNHTVLYLRVSTMDQSVNGVSLAAQESRLRDYCQLQQLEIIRMYIEEGVSGSKPLDTRPEGSKMLSFVHRNKIKHIVALKLDRLFRSAEDAMRQTKAWDTEGIALHLVDMGGQSLSTSSAIGRMLLTMMAAFAEFERNLISERTALALAHKKSQKQVYNHEPYGYERVGKMIVEQPEEQRIIRLIRHWRDEGETFQSIDDRLNTERIPAKKGGNWYPSTVQKILSNDLHKPTA